MGSTGAPRHLACFAMRSGPPGSVKALVTSRPCHAKECSEFPVLVPVLVVDLFGVGTRHGMTSTVCRCVLPTLFAIGAISVHDPVSTNGNRSQKLHRRVSLPFFPRRHMFNLVPRLKTCLVREFSSSRRLLGEHLHVRQSI